MKHETAGDPITGLKWTRKAPAKIALVLAKQGITVSANTVARLLRGMGFRLRANRKDVESGNRKPPPRVKRNRQFERINHLRESFQCRGLPTISVDTKKKELIGNFRNAGVSWEKDVVRVNDHDFHCDAVGVGIPYGIFDPQRNGALVCVGRSSDTPAFAVACIATWWRTVGSKQYPGAKDLLILADCGGSNGYRSRAWKYWLTKLLCEKLGISVTVCHYPPGASKWNPIEHRLFAQISRNWAGHPLSSYHTLCNYIRATTTTTGLSVLARLDTRLYEKGEHIPLRTMEQLPIIRDTEMPDWIYTIVSQKM
jgi:hypothetical protein